MNLKWVADHFDKLQYIFVAMVFIFAWFNWSKNQQSSSFKSREANRNDLDKLRKMHQKQTPATPLSLPGINLTGAAHEILGVDLRAAETEIMRAYKEKMKQFHPDRIQGQAREQIKFYEEAASKINQAKETMLASLKK